MFGDWKRDCTASTLVDSAELGSQDWALFFSAPVSLPASGPRTARMMSQRTSTAHLERRPLATPTSARALVMMGPPERSTERVASMADYEPRRRLSQDISRLTQSHIASLRRSQKSTKRPRLQATEFPRGRSCQARWAHPDRWTITAAAGAARRRRPPSAAWR